MKKYVLKRKVDYIMTKTILIKWLEGKNKKALNAAKVKYKEERSKLLDSACTELGLTTVAAKIEASLKKVDTVWSEWRKKHEGPEIESTEFYNTSFTHIVSLYSSKRGAALNAILTHMLEIKTKKMQIHQKDYDELCENINQSYTTVIEAVRTSKNAKEASVYLTGLGFDLSEVETYKAPVTALTIPINTAYLFIGKEEAA